MNPCVLGEGESFKTLSEVLNHVVPLGLSVNQKIKTNLVLESDYSLNLLGDESIVLGIGELSLSVLGTGGTNLLGLGERSNGGGS